MNIEQSSNICRLQLPDHNLVILVKGAFLSLMLWFLRMYIFMRIGFKEGYNIY